MSKSRDREAILRRVGEALALLDCRVFRNAFGDIDGVDTLSIGLDRMGDALADLVEFPSSADSYLEDVLAYLSAAGKLDPAVVRDMRQLREKINLATYPGVSGEELALLEGARGEVHRKLSQLVADYREGETHG